MTGGPDQSVHNVPPLEISCSAHKRISQSQARFGTRLNLESGGSVLSPFHRFAASPSRPWRSVVPSKIWETRAKHLPDLVLDLVHVTRTVDQHNPFWLPSSKVAIRFANTLVKLLRLLLHSVWSP